MDTVGAPSNRDDAGPRRLLERASIEVTARDSVAVDTLPERFAPGTDVHVTFLPDDDLDQTAETCVRLRRAGFNPTPHLTARNFTDRVALDRQLGRLSDEAGVTRALVIAGDVPSPRGPYASSLELLKTGLIEKHGIRSVLLAGHPEAHPAVSANAMEKALQEKLAYARAHDLVTEIVTQFAFEAPPILDWLVRLRARGIDAPVRFGLAGPAGAATLLKYGMRCGVGNSIRALRRRAGTIGKLMGDTTPDELLADLAAGLRSQELGPFAGIHIYTFGGMRKTSDWLAKARQRASEAVAKDEVE